MKKSDIVTSNYIVLDDEYDCQYFTCRPCFQNGSKSHFKIAELKKHVKSKKHISHVINHTEKINKRIKEEEYIMGKNAFDELVKWGEELKCC